MKYLLEVLVAGVGGNRREAATWNSYRQRGAPDASNGRTELAEEAVAGKYRLNRLYFLVQVSAFVHPLMAVTSRK
ncbi:hypothetical protein [Pseudomonas syringae]|uniref:hypothetical protein n=1 Tax=Pseudomonas syringae TaxID=317 RepID=UPI000944B5A9|nr:hypothetical protein [Pseudomonas syringae]